MANKTEIRDALAEYKEAQYQQIKAVNKARNVGVYTTQSYSSVALILSAKAVSCSADAELHASYGRVFAAAARLIEALDSAGYGEA